MRLINEAVAKPARGDVKVLQFGEGNFLRAFVDYMLDIANEKGVFDGRVAIVKPIAHGGLDAFNAQDCIYTVILRGIEGGKTVSRQRAITSVAEAIDPYAEYARYAALAELPQLRFVVSNTTEAGIVCDEGDDISLTPPRSYPGKLTKLLYERWRVFDGAPDKGLIILPVELIDNNGGVLRECCMRLSERWGLPAGFKSWLTDANIFCSTLVDRIVTGYPQDEYGQIAAELGYDDRLLVTAEPFALWVIEGAECVRRELPLERAGLPVVFTDDLKPYRERKVRILNGAHTSTVPAAYLAGLNTVGELMRDRTMRALIERNVYGELLPYVPLPEAQVKAFADSVMERFENPFIKHSLLAISLNSVSKFRARVLPTIKDAYARNGKAPEALCFSLAALMAFYSGDMDERGRLIAKRGEEAYEILDDRAVLEFFNGSGGTPADELTRAFLAREDFWGESLAWLADTVAGYLQGIRTSGVRAVAAGLCGARE